jgi:single-stranded DNA-binding protein
MNRIFLLGTVITEPRTGETRMKSLCCAFTMEINQTYNTKNKSLQQSRCELDVRFYGAFVDLCKDKLHVGDVILVAGSVVMSEIVDKRTNTKMIKHSVIGNELEFITQKNKPVEAEAHDAFEPF